MQHTYLVKSSVITTIFQLTKDMFTKVRNVYLVTKCLKFVPIIDTYLLVRRLLVVEYVIMIQRAKNFQETCKK